MADPFNGLISSGMSNALMAGAGMFGQQQSQNAALADRRESRDMQMLQYTMGQDANARSERQQARQFDMQLLQSDRAMSMQREESAFARLNSALDRQLKVAEIESTERQRAFENTLRAQTFDIQAKAQTAQLKQIESQTRQVEKAERFKDFLGEFSVLESEMLHGDGRAKATAALALNTLVKKNTGVLGVDPAFASRVGQINSLASELSTGYFKVLDDADPSIKGSDLETTIGGVDASDGFDADETQVVSVLLGGFRFSAPTTDVASRRAEFETYLAKMVPGESGKTVVSAFAERLFKDANTATKFFEMTDRGAFMRPLSTDEVADIKAFRNELKSEEMQMMSALRNSGLSPSERGQILAAEQRKNSLALESYALRIKGTQDPDGLGQLKGSNVMTREATAAAIEKSVRPVSPLGKVDRVAGAVGTVLDVSNPPALLGRAMRAGAGVAKGWYDGENLRFEIDKFYQDHVDPVRLGNGATIGDPNAMAAWASAVDAIAQKFGGRYSETAIKEALHYSKHVPTWVSEDRALTPVAMRVVPGYTPGLFETPSEAIRRSLVAEYQTQQSQAYAGATTRANQILSGGKTEADIFASPPE